MIRGASHWAPLVVVALTLAACACGEDAPVPPPTTPRVDPSMLEAATRHQVAWTDEARATAIAAGTEALTRNQCNRCHVIDEVAAAGRSEHCVSCHVFLDHLPPDDRRYRTLVEHYGEPVIQRYQRNIEHYLIAPDLTNVASRLRPEWIAEFIAEPQDLRPMMDETMVRTRLSDADRTAIVRYFAAVARVAEPGEAGASTQAIEGPPRPSDEAMAEGRRLFTTHACNTCHMLGNVDLGRSVEDLERAGLPARLAPNLRFVRERILPDVALQWILDPQSLHPETTMPNLHLSGEEATLLRDWIWHVDPELEPTPAPSTHALPAALDRPVSWEEVKERVLGRICVHCHMNDHERDPGPGHVGGYGWPAAGLRMRTYESLVSGMPCADPLLAPRGGGAVPVRIDRGRALLGARAARRRGHPAAARGDAPASRRRASRSGATDARSCACALRERAARHADGLAVDPRRRARARARLDRARLCGAGRDLGHAGHPRWLPRARWSHRGEPWVRGASARE